MLQLLWNEAKNYPMYNLLGEPDTYAFVCVNTAAEQEELEEEHRRLCDVRLFLPVLRLMPRVGDRAEKLQNASISVLIGKGSHAPVLHTRDAKAFSKVIFRSV